MKSRLALAALLALPLGLVAMPTAVEYLPGTLDLKQGVRLVDGSVLPAGHYDVQIHYQGWGNSAEFWFFKGGALKGKTKAEARGFPSSAPVAIGGAGGDVANKKFGKIEPPEDKHKLEIEAAQKDKIYETRIKGTKPTEEGIKKVQPGAEVTSFSWGKYGFQAGAHGNDTLTGNRVKISFDSSNSAAGFTVTLPYIETRGK